MHALALLDAPPAPPSLVAPSSLPPRRFPSHWRALHALIADADAPTRHLARQALERIGLENLVEADDGWLALDHLQAHETDILVLGWNTPGIGGLELLRTLRTQGHFALPLTLMIGGENHPRCVQQAMALGASGCVAHPVRATTLQVHAANCLSLAFQSPNFGRFF